LRIRNYCVIRARGKEIINREQGEPSKSNFMEANFCLLGKLKNLEIKVKITALQPSTWLTG